MKTLSLKTCPYLVAAVVLFLCSAAVAAETVPVDGECPKIAAVVALRNASPTSVMWSLGLFQFGDLKSGDTSVWRSDGKSPSVSIRKSSPSALPGIDLVVPCEKDRVLVIYGEKAAVDELKAMVAQADVVEKRVQVKAEILSLPRDEAEKLEIALPSESGSLAGIDPARLNELAKSWRDAGAEVIGRPTFTTINNFPAEFSVVNDSRSFRMCVLPRINADGTISLMIDLSATEQPAADAPERTQSVMTQRRIAEGDSAVLAGFTCGSDALLVVLTPTIVD